MKISFLGGARQVTGSMYLLELEDGYKILVDCGIDMEKGRSKDFILDLPIHPSEINLVLLTHAHVDHSGNLPLLIKEGYEGQILCTAPTYYLSALLLNDSAMLQQKKISSIGNSRSKKHRKKVLDNAGLLYNQRDVEQSLNSFLTIAFNKPFRVNDHLSVTFIPIGHILGAASIVITYKENNVTQRIGFSGDVGRRNYPLLPDPQPLPQLDYLVMETTYGDREHVDIQSAEDILEQAIMATCVEKSGRLIIPAFSVGRTQSVIITLRKLADKHKLPPIKIYVDSPMAIESTKIYARYPNLLNKEAKEIIADGDDLFDFENLIFLEKSNEGKYLGNHAEPCVIISAAGMLEGGRIQRHIAANIHNPYCTVLLVGYSSEGTLGRKLMDGLKIITINGKDYPVLADIKRTDIFSGHAGKSDLEAFLAQQDPTQLKQLFLVHGENSSMENFKKLAEEKKYQNVEMPRKGSSYELS